MQVSVETKEGLERLLMVEIPSEQVDTLLTNEYNKYAKNAKLPGFRPGKIPLKMIKQRYGAQIKEGVASTLIQETLQNAVVESKVELAGVTEVKPEPINDGEVFKYAATVEVYPEFEIVSLENTDLERTVGEITQADIDTMMENLRKQRSEWNEVDRAAANDDQVTLDFAGSMDGEAIPQATSENFELVLGSKSMIPGFEEALLDMKKGDEKTVDLPFPEDYHAKDMAGKTVQFKLTVNAVKEAKLPELNEDFAKSLDVKEGGVEALRQKLEESMRRELADRLKMLDKQLVFNKLADINEVQIPNVLVQQELQNMKARIMQRMNLPKDKQAGFDFPMEAFVPQAKSSVKLHILLSAYVKKHDLKADDDKVNAYIEHVAEAFDEKENLINYYKNNPKHMDQVRMQVIEELAVEKLLSEAKVKEVSKSYEEIMKDEGAQQAV